MIHMKNKLSQKDNFWSYTYEDQTLLQILTAELEITIRLNCSNAQQMQV